MQTLWSKNYHELAAAGRKGIYSAYVRPNAPWDGWTMFQAIPNSGGTVLEFKSQDATEVVAVAEAWLRGEEPKGIYSASD